MDDSEHRFVRKEGRMEPIYWLMLFVVLLGIEILTMGLTTIWFAGGALAAFLISLIGCPVWLQAVVFIAVSLILLLVTRPFAIRYLNQRTEKTNVDSLIGKHAVVEEEIDNLEAKGSAQVQGVTWTARSEDDAIQIPAGALVRIVRIDGVKLIVRKAKDNEMEFSEQMKEQL